MFTDTTAYYETTPEMSTAELQATVTGTTFQGSTGGALAVDDVTTPTAAFAETTWSTTTQGDGRNFRLEDPVQRTVLGLVYCLVSVVGLSGNLMVILAVWLSKKLQTRTNAFVVNLAVADLVTCMTAPFTALALLSLDGWPLPMVVCSVAAGVFYTSLACSITTLAAIAINRYVLITKPTQTYRAVYTPRKIAAMLVFTWVYPALVCCLPLVGIGRWGYSDKYKTCTQDTSHDSSDTFSLLGSVLMYPVQLTILFVCYFKIYRHIVAHMKKMEGKKEPSATSTSSSLGSSVRRVSSQGSSRGARLSRRQVEITKNLFYVVCAFVACLAPFAVALTIPPSDPVIPWTSALVIFNSALNPIIYGLKHPHFKEVFGHMLRCRYHMIPEPSGSLRKIRSIRSI